MSQTTDKAAPLAKAENSGESESAFRRWSRRKHEARAAVRPEAIAPAEASTENPVSERPPAEPVLTDADMPPVDSLDENSDFSPFMSPGVSEALRQAALRRLFQSPTMNVLCELEGEFFDARGYVALGNIVTYDMRAAMERELEKAKASIQESIEASADESAAPATATPAERVESAEPPEPVQTVRVDSDTGGDV